MVMKNCKQFLRIAGVASCFLVSMSANSYSCDKYEDIEVIEVWGCGSCYGEDEFGNWHGPNPEWEPDYGFSDDIDDPCDWGCEDDDPPRPKEDPKKCE
jgi:hypothetical protein